MNPLSPAYDPKITRRYSARTIEHKVENKTALQRELNWPMEPKAPVICFPTGMSDALGGELLKQLLPGLLAVSAELLVLGKGENDYGELFTGLAKERGHRIAILPNDDDSIRKMLAASDIALFLTDPCALPELTTCLQYGVVPVAPECKGLEDYNPVQETGNAFLAGAETPWLIFAALVRALETFKFPFDWRTIQRHGMESVHEEKPVEG
ncbi:MAG TPA: hypothetical protein DEB30_02870 [Candidatus Peribacter riflensis]|uniref:Starch synthase n=1 Tax=Candidatus Peribacter riflensis TaxID=1735162 RepID=A0A0S1SS05_9BACT|nr:MAG: starch synthase [Candidatus Peribacter riflensis]OGJ77111.1 MAG: hypothetical protein A2398_03270 [Candidatus Peribacteria bacterium RIFOXYB1_FULL_57_12]ALM11064.1 MAG: starch synthase [Candidatus Peribacter riflensis]ALM12167.1 MAG: starch synthase [Candidatus Peribacter riflensis]ALM13270.1 MAG: starch synthase [Candidatus Peribacter riflensis]